MDLRDNPRLSRDGKLAWPPAWAASVGHGTEMPGPEDGRLVEVQRHSAQGTMPSRLTLRIEHRGHRFGGVFAVDDPNALNHMESHLRNRIGWSIREIGNEDVKF